MANEKQEAASSRSLPRLVRRDLWNKCEVCGRIISYADLASGKAIHNMKTPDSEVSFETWETLCRDHYTPNSPVELTPR